MQQLNSILLQSYEFADELFSSPINGTNSRGVYNPMQFVLRLREDIHKELENLAPGVNVTDSFIEDDVEIEEDETEYVDQDFAGTASGTLPMPIKYKCPARLYKLWNGSSEIIESVSVYGMTAEPVYNYYIDGYNRNVTRYLQTLAFTPTVPPLPAPTVTVKCKCDVNARYSYTDGSPTWTRQWEKTLVKTY